MGDFPVQILRSEAELLALKDDWNRLSESAEYPNLFTSWDWQTIWLKWFGKELRGEPFVLLVRNGAGLIGIVPFYRRRRSPLLWGSRSLSFIGFGGLTCPEYLGPIILRGHVDEVVDATVEYLQKNPAEWDSIFMEDYALDDPGTVRLADRLRETFFEHSGEGETRYSIHFTGDYDAYLATLSYNSRRQRRKRFNQAETRFGARIEYPTASDLDRAFPILVDLTTQARTRHGEENPFQNSTYAGFHRELLETLLPQDRAILPLLILNEEPAAIWYCFTLGKKCYAYQQGFSPKFEGSPSDVCQQFMIRRLTSEQFVEFDYLRGQETYKESCANASRETRWAFFFRRRGLAWLGRTFLDRWARPVYRRLKAMLRKKENPSRQSVLIKE